MYGHGGWWCEWTAALQVVVVVGVVDDDVVVVETGGWARGPGSQSQSLGRERERCALYLKAKRALTLGLVDYTQACRHECKRQSEAAPPIFAPWDPSAP
jgi:hypothetical protein